MFDIPVWVYIGLVAQCLWVAGNLFDKYLIEKYFKSNADDGEDEGTGTLVLFSALFASLLSGVIWIFFYDQIAVGATSMLLGTTIGVLNAAWVIAYLYAIGRSELTKTVPIFQTIPIFGFIFGYLLLSEVVTVGQFIAALFLISGAFILSYNFRDKKMYWLPLLLMLLASALVALQEVIFKLVALETNFITSAFWQGIGLGIVGVTLYLVVPTYRKQFNSLVHGGAGKIWGISAVNEVFDNAATLVFSYAVILGPVFLVQSVNAYQPVILLSISYVIALFFGNYLQEDTSQASTVQKIVGIGVVTLGSVYLYYTI